MDKTRSIDVTGWQKETHRDKAIVMVPRGGLRGKYVYDLFIGPANRLRRFYEAEYSISRIDVSHSITYTALQDTYMLFKRPM
jgi:hypothetical protein